MTDEGTCVSPACVKQETPANEAIRPKIEFDELVDNAFFVKEEEEPPKTVGHLHGDSTINPTPTTILGGKAARNIKEEEEEQAESIKSDLTDDDSEEIKEEIDEIKYTESEVCDNKIKDTISCDGDNVNSMQDSTNKQEGHNGKTRSKRRHNLLIIETTTNGNATISTPKKRPKNHLSVEQKNQILNTFKAYTSSHPENIKVQNVKFTARATALHTCPACQKTFSIYRYFEAHTDLCVNKNVSRQKKHECQECNYKTKRLCNLRRHMLSHSGERRYHCNECDYKAIHKAHLQVHIKYKHIKEKPYSCDLCDYKCTQYYMLNKHKIVHQEEKPFRCEVCGKEFKQKSCLDMHMYCHTKEQRPYKCGQCDFSAFTQSSLNTHVKHTHSGEKPFKCAVCDYKTVTATRLKRHMYKHGEEKPFKCEQCSFQCVLRRKLQKHVSIKHVKVETQ